MVQNLTAKQECQNITATVYFVLVAFVLVSFLFTAYFSATTGKVASLVDVDSVD